MIANFMQGIPLSNMPAYIFLFLLISVIILSISVIISIIVNISKSIKINEMYETGRRYRD